MDTPKIQLKRLLEHVLEKFINYIEPDNPNLYETWFTHEDNEYVDTPDFTEKEYEMGRSLITLLVHCHRNDPSRLNIKKVKTLNDIRPVLTQKLDNILANYNWAEILVVKHPLEILSRREPSFQRFVVDCLVLAGKYMAQCMKKLDPHKVFDNTLELLEDYFLEYNVEFTIEYQIQVKDRDPFGIIPDKEYPLDESDSCMNTF